MALFSLKRIAGEAENRQTYLRGVACYNAGKVGRVESGTGTIFMKNI